MASFLNCTGNTAVSTPEKYYIRVGRRGRVPHSLRRERLAPLRALYSYPVLAMSRSFESCPPTYVIPDPRRTSGAPTTNFLPRIRVALSKYPLFDDTRARFPPVYGYSIRAEVDSSYDRMAPSPRSHLGGYRLLIAATKRQR